MIQPGFFDFEERLHKIDCNGDPLSKISAAVDWEIFRPELEKARSKAKKSNAGAKLYDVILMFKILILQSLYNLSDGALEFQILDRHSFCRFLGFHLCSKIPDATTVKQRGNRTRSKIRSRVEHIFGVQAQKAGNLILRTIGMARARAKIGLRNLAYNIDRFGMLFTPQGRHAT